MEHSARPSRFPFDIAARGPQSVAFTLSIGGELGRACVVNTIRSRFGAVRSDLAGAEAGG